MDQNSKIKSLKACSCGLCRSRRGTAWGKRKRKEANRRIRRRFRDVSREDGLLFVISMDRV